LEVCSSGELQICKAYSVSPKKIIFLGINKNEEDIQNAFSYGFGAITAESLKQFLLIWEYCKKFDYSADIYLRLSDGVQFGIEQDSLEMLVKTRENYPNLHIKGIHYFSGTQKQHIEKNFEELERLYTFLEKLQNLYNLKIKILKYGTGLQVPYLTNQNFSLQYDRLQKIIYTSQKRLEKIKDPSETSAWYCKTI